MRENSYVIVLTFDGYPSSDVRKCALTAPTSSTSLTRQVARYPLSTSALISEQRSRGSRLPDHLLERQAQGHMVKVGDQKGQD